MTPSTPVGHRYHELFTRLAAENETAFIPFAVLGDPTPSHSEAVLQALVSSGADALELGIPFSDPVADGPTIQAAATRAIDAGTRVEECWDLIAGIRSHAPSIPIGLLVYANLVHRRGLDRFYDRAASAGVDSVLVADAPLLEIAPFQAVARARQIATVLIAPPNADATKLASIAGASEGYTYVVTRAGVTGMDDLLHEESAGQIEQLLRAKAAPPVHGFGISRPEHVRLSRRLGARGAISGSAIVRRIAGMSTDRSRALEEVSSFVRAMKEATRTT